jgi:hypothetical protein
MSSAKTYPKLEQFLGAHFHQDWSLVDPDSAAVVAHYLEKAPAASRAGVVRELEKLRAEGLKEAQLRKLLGDLGCCFEPASERRTFREWLDWLHAALSRRPAAKRPR